ncbi:MAG: murein hydrolase activator EnvC family protein, partial [bacterium]
KYFSFTFSTFIFFACMFAPVSGQDTRSDDLEKIKSKIGQLEKKLASQNKKETETLEILDTIDQKMSTTKRYVSRLKTEIGSQKKKITGLELRLGELGKNMKSLQAGFANRIVSVYKYGRISTLELLFGAKSLHQVQVWAEYQRRLSENDSRKMNSIKAEQDKLLNTQNDLTQAIGKEQQLLREKSKEEIELANDRKDRKRLLDNIRNDKRTYQKQIEDNNKAILEIQRLIAKSERESATETREAVDFIANTPFASLKGRLPWPAQGKVLRAYGKYQHPVLKTVTENLGIDIELEAGASVHAVADGKVTAVTWQRGRGNLIIINHSDGYYTVYTHLDEILVNLQQTITAGQLIGKVGETGSLEGPLLHFQVWNKFNHLDPEAWLR